MVWLLDIRVIACLRHKVVVPVWPKLAMARTPYIPTEEAYPIEALDRRRQSDDGIVGAVQAS